MRTRLRNLLLGAVQRPRWQPLFARLRWLSLVGMNIGGGGDVESSGERHVLRRIRRCTGSRRLVVFDVGSNVGHYAQLALAELGPDTAVHCFEPSARTFPELQRNVSQFATIENFGFSDHPQTLPLFSHHERPGLSSLYDRRLDYLGLQLEAEGSVSLRTVDDYCLERGIEHIDLLKLDVEGHELNVLNGARGMLSREAIDFVQFEFGGCNIDSRTFFRDFFYALPNYRIYRILSRGLWPLDEYNERLESFVTTNYFAARRTGEGDLLQQVERS